MTLDMIILIILLIFPAHTPPGPNQKAKEMVKA